MQIKQIIDLKHRESKHIEDASLKPTKYKTYQVNRTFHAMVKDKYEEAD